MKKTPKPSIPFNQFLVGVYYNRSLTKYSDREKYPMGDPDRYVMFGHVTADMAMDPPDPPITTDEMQSVARAAKMALYKVMMNRKKKVK
jgi:hypothetical protein